MKKWKFVEPGLDDEPVFYALTEQEIFEKYWPYFYGELYNPKHNDNPNVLRLRDLPLALQRQRCIDDYIVINWGWEVDE